MVERFVGENLNPIGYRDYRRKFALTDETAKFEFGDRTIVGLFQGDVLKTNLNLRVWIRLFEHYRYLDHAALEVVGYSLSWYYTDSTSAFLYNSLYHSQSIFSSRELDQEFERLAINIRTVKLMRMSQLKIFAEREEEKNVQDE